MTIRLRLTESVSDITKKINTAISIELNKLIQSQTNNIVGDFKKLIPSWLYQQPEIIWMLDQSPLSLSGYFGIVGDTSSIVNSIIGAVVNSLSFKFRPYSANLKGGFDIYIQPNNFSDLLSLSKGHTIYKGGDLHWLDWLLLRGDEIIIANYQYNPQTGLGRSGLGNMQEGGAFRIPPQYSGTKDNNFITRALTDPSRDAEITKIFSRYLG